MARLGPMPPILPFSSNLQLLTHSAAKAIRTNMKPILCLLSLSLLVYLELGSCALLQGPGDDGPVYLVGGERDRREAEDEPVYLVQAQRDRREAEDDFVDQNDDQRNRREAEAEDAELGPDGERFRRAMAKTLADSFDQLNVGESEARQRRWLDSVIHGFAHGANAFFQHLGGKR